MFSRKAVRAFAAVLAVGSFAVMTGCDWLKASEPDQKQSPYISSLGISPSSVLCARDFSISFRYDDPQGDIASARVTFQLSGDTAVREETPLWPDTISRSSGTAKFIFSFPCDSSSGGVWSITVQVKDDRGHTSNTLSGQIRLNAAG